MGNEIIKNNGSVNSEELLEQHGLDGVDVVTSDNVDDSSSTLSDSKGTKKRDIEKVKTQDEDTVPEEVKKTTESDNEVEKTESDVLMFKTIDHEVVDFTYEDDHNANVIDGIFHSISSTSAYDDSVRNATEVITNSGLLCVDGIGQGGKSTHTRSIRMVRDSTLSVVASKKITNNVVNENFSGTDNALTRAKSLSVKEYGWLSLGMKDESKEEVLTGIFEDAKVPTNAGKFYKISDINERAKKLSICINTIMKYVNSNVMTTSKIRKSSNEGEVFVFFEEDDKRLSSVIQTSFTVLADNKGVTFAIKYNKKMLDAEQIQSAEIIRGVNERFVTDGFDYALNLTDAKGAFVTYSVDLDMEVKFLVPMLLISSNVIVSAWNVENVVVPDKSKVSSAFFKGGSSVGTVTTLSKLSIWARKYDKSLTLEYLDLFSIDGSGLISANCNYIQLSGNFMSTHEIADSGINNIRFRDSNLSSIGIRAWEQIYALITALRNNFNITKNEDMAVLLVATTNFSKSLNNYMNSTELPIAESEIDYNITNILMYFVETLSRKLNEIGVNCTDLSMIISEVQINQADNAFIS